MLGGFGGGRMSAPKAVANSAKIDKSFSANMVEGLIKTAVEGHKGIDWNREGEPASVRMILAYVPWPPPGILITFEAVATVGAKLVKKDGGIAIRFSVSATLKVAATLTFGFGSTLTDNEKNAGLDPKDVDIRKKIPQGVTVQMYKGLTKGLLSKSVSTANESFPEEPDTTSGSLSINIKLALQYLLAETSFSVDVFKWEFGKDAQLFVGGKCTTKFGLTGLAAVVRLTGGGELKSTLTTGRL
jgi:hypothetical protein